nr:sulfatase-like hydrolase/transferase [Mariniblastus fucicola]
MILLMSDDQGWGDVGFNGNKNILTPNLDAMAAAGVKFNRFYAASPLCSPTRGSSLTGRYPFRFGVLAAHTGGMRVGEVTVAEMLKQKGYRTGFFGKWHIGWVKEEDAGSRGFFSPPGQHGFDHWFATTSAVPTWDPCVTPKGWKKWGATEGQPWKGGAPYVLNGTPVTENMAGDDSRVVMDRVIDFISDEKQNDRPFLATVWFHAPHEPVVAGEEYQKLYPDAGKKRKNYYGCITAMDEQIGRLQKKLQELQLTDNTIVFFCSDNGPADGLAKKGIASAGKFKGHKHQMYEGGTLVPACAVWPGVIPNGTVTDVRCATVDFFPTIANIVDFKFKEKPARPIDGIDLLPVVRGETSSRPTDLFFGYRRLVSGIDGQGLIRGDWKILQEATKGDKRRIRLYNLASDPYERKDLAQQNPEMLESMKQAMQEVNDSCARSRDGADYRY